MGVFSAVFGVPRSWRPATGVVAGVLALSMAVMELPAAAAASEPAAASSATSASSVSVSRSAARDDQGDLTAPDAVAASVNARLTGERVEDLSQRTESSSTFALPDGSWQTSYATEPVWVRRGGDGTSLEDWAAQDSSLSANGDGSYSPVAQAGGVRLSGAREAAGGVSVVASLTDPETGVTSQVTFPGDLPAPKVRGSRARYSGVLPGVDMVVDVTGTGVEQYFVVQDRPADPRGLDLAMGLRAVGPAAKGVAAKALDAAKGGDVARLVTAGGQVASAVATPLVWDAAYDAQLANPVTEPFDTDAQPGLWAGTADGANQRATVPTGDSTANPASTAGGDQSEGLGTVAPIATEVTTVGSSATVDLTSDTAAVAQAPADARSVADVLADPDTVFPVVVDPSVSLSFTFDAYVQTRTTTDRSSDTELRVGTYDGGTTQARSFLTISTPQVKGKKVLSATMKLWEFHSWSCTPKAWQLWSLKALATKATRWSNQPGMATQYASSSQTKGFSSDCAAGWVSVDATDLAQAFADTTATSQGIGMRATSETDSYGWKRFNSGNAASGKPTFTVTYNSYPAKASGGSIGPHVWYPDSTGQLVVKTRRPQVKATVSDPDGGSVWAQFHLEDQTTGKVVWNWVSGSKVASGSVSAYTPTTDLPEGHTYALQVRGWDGSLASTSTYRPYAVGGVFTIDAQAPAAPTVTASSFTKGQWKDPAPGSNTFTFTATDPDVVSFQYLQDDNTTWKTVTASGTTPKATLSWNPTGSHKLTVRAIDKAGWASGVSTFTFGAGGAALTSPVGGSKSTGKFTARALGPADANGPATVTAYYRLAGGPAASGDSAANGSTSGWTAIDGSATTVAQDAPISYAHTFDAPAIAAANGAVRGTLQLQVQVCAKYTSGTTRCTWNGTAAAKNKPTVTYLPSAFGNDFPTADAGPGQVALWTGEYSQSATDVSVPGYAGDMSIGRTYTSLDTPAEGSVFGPGWAASFDGTDAGVAGWEVVDHTRIDGTLALLSGDGEVLIYRQDATTRTAQWVGTYLPADQDTLEAGATVKVAAGSPKTMVFTDPGGVATTFAYTSGQWRATAVTDPADPGATIFTRDAGTGNVTRILAPYAAGIDCTATLAPGCRALNLAYATSTTATSTTDGDVKGQVKQVSYTAYDPATAAMKTQVVATYRYNSAGQLTGVSDPRTGQATTYGYAGTSDSGQPLLTSSQDSGQAGYTLTYGAVRGASPDGTASAATTVTKGLQTVKQDNADSSTGSVQVARFVYSIDPTTYTASSNLPDLRAADASDPSVGVGRWGQAVTPTYGAGVFGMDKAVATSVAPSVAAANWPYADLQYTSADGRVIDTANYGAGDWQYTATEYDENGNPVKAWDARGIAAILANGDTAGAESYATITAYNDDLTSSAAADGPDGATSVPAGTVIAPADTWVTDTWGPATDAAGEEPVRAHTHTDYDQGAPNAGVNPETGMAFGLVTTTTTTQVAADVATSGTGETVIAQAKSGYAPQDGSAATSSTSGWTLGSATTDTTVTDFTAGTGPTTTTTYDAQGRVTKTIGPKSNGADAGTQLTSYYTAAANPDAPQCGGAAVAQWAGLACQTRTAETTPTLPVQTITGYSFYGAAQTTTETKGPAVRTTRAWYDEAGRATGAQTTTSGVAGSAPTDATVTHYNTQGLVDYTAGIDPASIPAGKAPAAGNETDRVTTGYDAWGRVTGYTDATGTHTSTGYVPAGQPGAGQPATISDPQSTTSYSYDQTTGGKAEHRGLVTTQTLTGATTAPLTYRASYDAAGDLTSQVLPAGITQTIAYSRDGQQTALAYDGTAADGTTTPLLGWALTADALGRTTRVSTNAGTGDAAVGRALAYGYDHAGRLTSVTDARGDVCQARTYSFDGDSNRTGQTAVTSNTGDCADSPEATVEKTWAYDAADRVQTGATTTVTGTDEAGDPVTTAETSGGGAYGYDALGRVTTLPGADTPTGTNGSGGDAGGAVAVGYYDTDAAHTLTQDGTTTSYTLDPAGRRRVSTATQDGADPVTITRHYGDEADNPSFATQTTGTGSPVVSVYGDSIGGDLAVTITGGVASVALADPHGDTITTLDLPTDGGPALISTPVLCFDEYGNQAVDLNQTQVDADGNPVDTTSSLATGALAYGHLGAKQRATDPTGLQLMGARLYNPATGTFTSLDPIPGGNENAYTYPLDPINSADESGMMRTPQPSSHCACNGQRRYLGKITHWGRWRAYRLSWIERQMRGVIEYTPIGYKIKSAQIRYGSWTTYYQTCVHHRWRTTVTNFRIRQGRMYIEPRVGWWTYGGRWLTTPTQAYGVNWQRHLLGAA